jgi:hypothetical protein
VFGRHKTYWKEKQASYIPRRKNKSRLENAGILALSAVSARLRYTESMEFSVFVQILGSCEGVQPVRERNKAGCEEV